MIHETAGMENDLSEKYYSITSTEIQNLINENMTEEVKLPKGWDNIHDITSKVRTIKLNMFVEKLLGEGNSAPEKAASLQQLGKQITENDNIDPEAFLVALTSSVTRAGMERSNYLARRDRDRLESVINKILKMENEGHINTNKYNELVKKRTRIEEKKNYLNKFSSVNRISARSDRCTRFFLSDINFSSKPKLTK